MADTYYIHSAIPYVNAAPHIGHAQEFVYADALRRYQILLGKKVAYLSGADENALKIVQAAEKANMDPQKFCDIHSQEFLDVAAKLNVHFDYWQRGTDKVHHFPAAQKLWNLCLNKGDIYKKSYEGLYCVGCESFYTPEELDDNGECFEHPGRKLETVSEENYFFKLSKYQNEILELIENDELKIFPNIRKNEALAFIKKGLEDFSVSRSSTRAKNWGVPVPNDPSQIMYVWFDALNIYQSGIGFGWDEKLYKTWWPAKLMVIGKGILRFHAIYWIAILKSAGLKLPEKLFVHGYLTVDGQKMSKTLGNVVDPLGVIQTFGSDATRYYLLREIPSYNDGDYSERRFKEIYNADLANGLGNLVARVAKLALAIQLEHTPKTFTEVAPAAYKTAMDECRLHDAIGILWDKIKIADQFINEKKPWKQEGKELGETLTTAISYIVEIATLLQPFMPDTAEKILTQFKGPTVTLQPSLFPRLS
jgi:methionyl-tRNA synthetase